MKKLTKIHMILIALFIAVLAVGVYFSLSYRKAEAKQPDIKDEISMALMRLETLKDENNPEALKEQLDELRAKIKVLDRDEPLFPKLPATVDIGDLIVDSMERLQLDLLKLKSNDEAGVVTIDNGSSEDAEGNKYSSAEYEVKVKGDVGKINSLIGEIEGAEFATLTIEDMSIDLKEKTEEELIIKWWESDFTVVTLYQYQEEEKEARKVRSLLELIDTPLKDRGKREGSR